MVVDVKDFKVVFRHLKFNKFTSIKKGGKWIKYHNIYCGFDIETTSIDEKAFMYIWQFSFKLPDNEPIVIIGRRWGEYIELLKFLRKALALRYQLRLIVFIANMSFEWQFMRHYIEVEELFAKESRQPLYILSKGIEFREALSISQGSLEYLAKCWTKTQKLVGDLDYTLLRNSKSSLDKDTELQYCINDVVILSEFSEKIFERYLIPEHYIPMTSTGILRHDLRVKAIESMDGKEDRLFNYIKWLYPATKEDYLFIMEYLFRGGYVHANYKNTDRVLYDLHGFDLKSSYPDSAFNKYYPVSAFEDVDEPSFEKLESLASEFCVIATITFANLESTTSHTIESLSKTIKCIDYKLDNGRVRKAGAMTVCITELDYESYKEFYRWDKDNSIIHSLKVAKRGELPKYLLDRFYYWFSVKESIDKHTNKQDYDISKTRINGHFGLCCTRLVFRDVCFEDGEWSYKPTKKSYEDMISKQVLSPYWGIWMTAHSRRVELSLLYKMREEVSYSDTDSHKLKLTSNVMRVVHDYNKMVKARNRAMCERYGYDFNILGKIGCLEWETSPREHGKMKRFKTLGAKRYICEYERDGFESTISGLGKKALDNYSREIGLDPFDMFEHKMTIPADKTGKLTATYIDISTKAVVVDREGNEELMREKSSIYLRPSTFTLSLDKDYIALLKYQLERLEKNG